MVKKPIIAALSLIINALSLGEFDKIKRSLNYDDMYHLYTLFKLSDDTTIRLEKNQVINISTEPTYEIEDSEYARVYDFGVYASDLHRARTRGNNQYNTYSDIFTLEYALERSYLAFPSVSGLNADQYWEYSGYNNNCQIFTMALLTGINRGYAPGIRDFVLQDTKKIIGNLNKFAQAVIQSATDAAALVNLFMEGA